MSSFNSKCCELLSFIVAYKAAADGNSPSYREMMRACRVSSLSVVRCRLRGLARAGCIRLLGDGSARSIVVVGGSWVAPECARPRRERNCSGRAISVGRGIRAR